ncbi:MAG: AbrB/MazE/SpoVT family DNA-binding domain-containing protein [Anaerolineales bacterium]|nr:AbrB/MazE/SpoVT family DNA-binding domain-containing protein [Anaerolineales bacterium]
MLNVRVSPKGQVTLPREIRRKLKIKSGDQMAVILDGDQIVFKPFTKTLLEIRGSVKVSGEQDFEKIRTDVLSKRAKRNASDEG